MKKSDEKELDVEVIKKDKKKATTKKSSSNTKKSEVKKEVTVIENVDTANKKPTKKSYFFERLAAYIIDIVIVSLAVSLVTSFIPENSNYVKINNELVELNEKYLNQEIDTDQYVHQSMEYSYDAAYQGMVYTFVQIIIIILYFIVFQFYNKGQTLGKKLLHLRVVNKNDDKLTMNDMLLRGLVFPSILFDLLIVAVTLMASGFGTNKSSIYFYGSSALEIIQSLILVATAIMVLYRKDGRGLHDLIGKTKVIKE